MQSPSSHVRPCDVKTEEKTAIALRAKPQSETSVLTRLGVQLLGRLQNGDDGFSHDLPP